MLQCLATRLFCLALTLAPLLAPAGARGWTFTTLYNFQGGQDGAEPNGGLIMLGGMLYGTTFDGGAPGTCVISCGTVFRMDPDTGAKLTLHHFNGPPDGNGPLAGLVAIGGMLYGTTQFGGSRDAGTLFKIDPATGNEQFLYGFNGTPDGAAPIAGLIAQGSVLYGTTQSGGYLYNACPSYGCGTLFSFDLTTMSETVLHRFQGGTDGSQPQSPLLFYHGSLFGTTSRGGGAETCSSSLGCGTVFQASLTGGDTVLYAFNGGADGYVPYGALVTGWNLLFGASYQGGNTCNFPGGCGVVFEVNPQRPGITTLHTFRGGQLAALPAGGVILSAGWLYGVTARGGGGPCTGGCGTIFLTGPISRETGLLHAFNHTDGEIPLGPLLAYGGAFYGVTVLGGTNGRGTVFKLVP